MEAKITRTIIDNDGVGIITNITEDSFVIKDVLIDKMPLAAKLTINYEEVKDGILEHVGYS